MSYLVKLVPTHAQHRAYVETFLTEAAEHLPGLPTITFTYDGSRVKSSVSGPNEHVSYLLTQLLLWAIQKCERDIEEATTRRAQLLSKLDKIYDFAQLVLEDYVVYAEQHDTTPELVQNGFERWRDHWLQARANVEQGMYHNATCALQLCQDVETFDFYKGNLVAISAIKQVSDWFTGNGPKEKA